MTLEMAAAAGDDANTVTPSSDTTQTLTDATNAFTQVTAYANAIANIVLQPATTPPETWFTTLDTALKSAQAHCTTWTETIGPGMSSTIPQALIDYGSLFTASCDDIISTLVNSKYEPDSDDRNTILGDIQTLLDFMATQTTAVATLQTQFTKFQSDVLADHTALTTGAGDAQKALNLDNETIATINATIAQLHADIAAASMKATASEIGIGLSIFVGLCAVVAVVATGGAAAPIVVGVVAVVGLGAAIGTTVVYTQQVVSDMAKLQEQQDELSTDQAQATALQSILTTTQTIVTANEAASAALTTLAQVWKDLTTKLTAVQTDLTNAHKAGDGKTFGAHAVKIWTSDAEKQWNQMITFATNMQTALLGTTVTSVAAPKAA